MKKLIYIIIVGLLINSCVDKKGQENNQGVVTYNITYPENISNSSFSAFLPEEMTTIFKDHNFKILLNGEFNIYKLEYISRHQGDTCFTLLKILDKKLFYPNKRDENIFLFNKHHQPQITYFKDSLKVIAGLNCQMGIASFTDSNIPDVKFYYTEEINFKKANVNTPFKDVPGMLLEFNINYQGIDLLFKAKNISYNAVKDDEFNIPKNYRPTNANEINEIVSSLMQL